MASVVRSVEAAEGRPAITYRTAGDRYLLVEYGAMTLDLRLNFFVIAVQQMLGEEPVDGVIEAAPGLRSLLVHYDSSVVKPTRLVEELDRRHESVPGGSELVIPSRRVTLPIAFDDSTSREAVERYITTIRDDAPNTAGGTNIDYTVEYNGLGDREALYEVILGTEWWNTFTGFFPGLPFMCPLDPRHEISVPKYNPTRTWTAEGAVGIGGPCVAVYPVESPGGYQLFGRTVTIFDMQRRNQAFAEDPILIRPGDRVTFERVTEEELLELRRQVFEDSYEYVIKDEPFVVSEYLEQVAESSAEVERLQALRSAAAARAEVP